jgi:predicted RNase H-like HicB family nuclease
LCLILLVRHVTSVVARYAVVMVETAEKNAGQEAKTPNPHDWTIEVTRITNGNGAYRASVVELKDCVYVGPTAQAALEGLDAVLERRLEAMRRNEEELPLPSDKDLGRLSIRIPKSVRRRLTRLSEVEGVSVNAVISSALSEYVGKGGHQLPGDFPSAGANGVLRKMIRQLNRNPELTDPVEAAVSVEATEELIRDVERLRGTNLGLALRILLADRKLQVEGEHEASRFLGKSAREAFDAGHEDLAEAVWKASIDLEDANAISHGAYGQFLFERHDYEGAMKHLGPDKSVLPWSPVQLALCQLLTAEPQSQSRKDAAKEVLGVLTRSAYEKRALAARSAWLRYARMLYETGEVSEEDISQLVERIRSWAKWGPDIETSEVLNGIEPTSAT